MTDSTSAPTPPASHAPQTASSPAPAGAPLQFAYWVPNVSGGLVISKIKQRTSWDIDYNRRLAQIAEASGFSYALSQIRFTAGYGTGVSA
jgi:FMNH2-dependent dimethyl sulfone monooxygenase